MTPMKKGVIHTTKTHTTAFKSLFLASLYTQIATKVKTINGIIIKVKRSKAIRKYKSLYMLNILNN